MFEKALHRHVNIIMSNGYSLYGCVLSMSNDCFELLEPDNTISIINMDYISILKLGSFEQGEQREEHPQEHIRIATRVAPKPNDFSMDGNNPYTLPNFVRETE